LKLYKLLIKEKMFKPVVGDQLEKFDPETIDLYRRRETDPKTVAELL
jgi:hypothetical protein